MDLARLQLAHDAAALHALAGAMLVDTFQRLDLARRTGCPGPDGGGQLAHDIAWVLKPDGDGLSYEACCDALELNAARGRRFAQEAIERLGWGGYFPRLADAPGRPRRQHEHAALSPP